MSDDSKTSWTPGPLRWLDADDWQETAERGQPFTISDADNDVAEVFHNNDSTVSTTPEQAAAYCRMFAASPMLVEALEALLREAVKHLPTDHPNGPCDKAITAAGAALSLATGKEG